MPPSLEDIGYALFGEGWHRCLAEALDVTEDDILAWETEVARRPADLQKRLENLGLARIGEIEVMLAQMKGAGLSAPEPG